MIKNSSYLKNTDTFIAAVIGFVTIYLFTKYSGVGISPDAIMYTSTARNIHDHGTLNFFNGQPIVDFPLGYPMFLGLIYLITGADPIIAGPFIDGLLFAMLLFLSGLIIERFAPGKVIYKWLVLAAVILSQALLQVYTYLWSETLFIVLVMVFFFAFANFQKKRTIKTLIIAALVAATVSVTRYAGVTVIATGGLLLLIDTNLPFKKRWKPIIIYALISCSLLAINLVRNHLVSGNSTGPRERSITRFTDNLSYFGGVIANWFTVTDLSKPMTVLIGGLVLLLLLAAFVSAIVKRERNIYLLLAISFSLVYGLFIILSSTFSRYEQINNRLLSPMYIPLLLALTWWIVSLPLKWTTFLKWVFYALFALVAIWIEVRLYKIDYQRYDDQFEYGNPGYTDDSWKESGTVTYLRKHKEFFKSDAPIYSDAYEAVYFFTGERSVKLLPHRYFDNNIRQFYAKNKFYLIWFKGLDNPELISLKDIQKQKKLKLIEQFNDGAIYEYAHE